MATTGARLRLRLCQACVWWWGCAVVASGSCGKVLVLVQTYADHVVPGSATSGGSGSGQRSGDSAAQRMGMRWKHRSGGVVMVVVPECCVVRVR